MGDRVVTITDFSALENLGDGGIANSYLKDGKHNICRCHNCNIALCDVWVTQPALKMRSKVSAICPKCKDKSLPVEVTGKFHLGATDHCDMTDVDYEYSNGGGEFINQILVVHSKLK